AKTVRLATAVWTRALRTRLPRVLRPTPDDEPESAQDAACLVAVEIGPVEAGGKAYHLLRRKSSAGDDDEMVT
ncbi:MAG: hypothetical protein ABR613_06490, partial [Actinomycetota bacterium]